VELLDWVTGGPKPPALVTVAAPTAQPAVAPAAPEPPDAALPAPPEEAPREVVA
jgi:hypothetical protein